MSVLDKIVESKKDEVRKRKKDVPVKSFVEKIKKGRNSFLTKKPDEVQIIAEIKRASPSKKDIAPNLIPENKALQYYKGGASAISVLTDYPYFKGTLDDLKKVKSSVDIPVLRKDFIIDEYQVYESAYYGADAVLLIAKILTKDQLEYLYNTSVELGIIPFVEIYGDEDLEKTDEIKNAFIGINNRNLQNFETSLDNVLFMAEKLDSSNIPVSLSGISSSDDVYYLFKRGINNFLIGEYLSKSNDSSEKIAEIIEKCRK
ncbi:MAG: indole-3-glycerol phosphate synthase TrpC [Thermodesulfobacteriota bacterium]